MFWAATEAAKAAPRGFSLSSAITGAVIAVLVGVAVEAFLGGVSRVWKLMRRWLPNPGKRYTPSSDALVQLHSWSPARILDTEHLRTNVVDRQAVEPQSWVRQETLDDAVAVALSAPNTGDVCYLTSVSPDHRESHANQVCVVQLTPAVYSEVRGIELLRATDPEVLSKADLAVAHDPRGYLATAVPSSIALNMVVVSETDEVLCLERSGTVDNGIGLWTVGAFETMKIADPNNPGRKEDFFALAQRALEEELGMGVNHYGTVYVTWLGIYTPLLRGHVVAVTRTKLSKTQVTDHLGQADSSYEHEGVDWLPLTSATLRKMMKKPRNPQPGSLGTHIAMDGRKWIDQAPLAISEALRFRRVLDD